VWKEINEKDALVACPTSEKRERKEKEKEKERRCNIFCGSKW
jgi:hypothetical protein